MVFYHFLSINKDKQIPIKFIFSKNSSKAKAIKKNPQLPIVLGKKTEIEMAPKLFVVGVLAFFNAMSVLC